MWVPVLGAIIIFPFKIYLWSLPLSMQELFLASLPFGIGYLGACLWAINRSTR